MCFNVDAKHYGALYIVAMCLASTLTHFSDIQGAEFISDLLWGAKYL